MTTLETVVQFLQYGTVTPKSFGVYHLVCLTLTILITVLMVWKFRDADAKTVRRILLTAWIVMVVLEIYKQVVFSYRENIYVPGHMIWSYYWFAFPFQFCSSPLYILPFVIWLKEGRFKDAFVAFTATFSVFGGLAVMLYPNDVFVKMLGINVQTMIHHGLQIILGVFLAARYRRRWSWKLFLPGTIPFAALSAVAIMLNEVMYGYITSRGIEGVAFNMFYISPHYGCSLPLLSAIYPKVPYPVFLLVYLLGFAVVAAVIFAAELGVIRLARRLSRGKGV